MTNKISTLARQLLISNTFFRAWNIITKIFVNIYILKSTGDLRIVAIFSILLLWAHLFSYWIFSWIVKHGYRNISHIFSVSGTVGIYLFFIFFPDEIGNYAGYIGAAIGVFSGIYWCVFNNYQFDLTIPKNRGNYEWLKKSLRTTVALLVPVIAWCIITLDLYGYGYQAVFLLGALCYAISGILGIVSVPMKVKSPFTPLLLLKEIKKHKDIWKYFFMFFFMSFALSMPLIEVLFPLIFYSQGIEELWIWFFVSWVSILSIFASYIFGKFLHYKYYKASFIVSGTIYCILITILIFFPSQLFLILFASCVTLLYVFSDIPLSVFTSNVLHDIKNHEDCIEEYMLFKEIAVIFGRTIVFVIILFLGTFGEFHLQILFTVMLFMMLTAIVLFYSTSMKHD